MRSLLTLVLSVLVLAFSSCRSDLEQAMDHITYEDLERHISILASDDFQGRKPFTIGEEKTLEYLEAEMQKVGLEPAFGGSYFQEVPLVEIKAEIAPEMEIQTPSGGLSLKRLEEYTAFTRRIEDHIELQGKELVFAGHGIVAPEYGWDDYSGIDVEGKIAVVFVNDPGYGTDKDDFFTGHAMTYYGRWTYKYEEAARQNAAGILIIHETGPAGYPWGVVRNGAESSKIYLEPDNGYQDRCFLEGWITRAAAEKLFEACGQSFEELKEQARTPGFTPFSLEATADGWIHNEFTYNTSQNAGGLIRGTTHPDELLVYTAHWDHLGICPPVEGDSIVNGATDNASAVSFMLEVADAFNHLETPPERSVLFLSITAEESGLLGSQYYTEHPIVPMNKTVANINTDVILFLGTFEDVTVTGYGQSEMDDWLAEAADAEGRYVLPDQEPENGMYYRSDHFSFARKGVPSLFAKGYNDQTEMGKEWTAKKIAEYWNKVYHKPADEYHPERDDLSGLVQDSRLFFRLGYMLANSRDFPEWKEGSEFKSIREESMNQ